MDDSKGHNGSFRPPIARAHITLDLPDDLVERLAPFQERLPELLERGLRDALRANSHSGTAQL